MAMKHARNVGKCNIFTLAY